VCTCIHTHTHTHTHVHVSSDKIGTCVCPAVKKMKDWESTRWRQHKMEPEHLPVCLSLSFCPACDTPPVCVTDVSLFLDKVTFLHCCNKITLQTAIAYSMPSPLYNLSQVTAGIFLCWTRYGELSFFTKQDWCQRLSNGKTWSCIYLDCVFPFIFPTCL